MSKKRKSMETNKIPMVNDFELIVPKFLANPVIRNKKPKLRLMNPVSKERNISTRKNQLVIPIKRKNVRKPMLIEVKNEPVDENLFNPTDRERLDRYNPIDDVEDIKKSKTLKFKNETRGLPIILYKNLRKKEYTQEQLEGIAKRVLKELGIDYSLLSKPQQQTAKRKVKQRIEFNNRKITEFFGKEPIEEEEEEEVETKKLTKQQKERLELLSEKARESKAVTKLRDVVKVKLQRLREAKSKREKEKAEQELKEAREKVLAEKKQLKEQEKDLEEKYKDTNYFEVQSLKIADKTKKEQRSTIKKYFDTDKLVEYKSNKSYIEKEYINFRALQIRGAIYYLTTNDKTLYNLIEDLRDLYEKFYQLTSPDDYNEYTTLVDTTGEIIVKLQVVYGFKGLRRGFTDNYGKVILPVAPIQMKYNFNITSLDDDAYSPLYDQREYNNYLFDQIYTNGKYGENLSTILKGEQLNKFFNNTEFEEKWDYIVYVINKSTRSQFEYKVELIIQVQVDFLKPIPKEIIPKLLETTSKTLDKGQAKELFKLVGKEGEKELMKQPLGWLIRGKLTDDDGVDKFVKNVMGIKSGYKFGKKIFEGKGIKDTDFKNIIEATYKPRDVTGWTLDKTISSPTSKVWKKNDGNHVVISHKGTQGFLDWANNAMFVMGGEVAYKLTPRYKEAYRVQKLAERKYGRDYKISTIGHSQGGLQAQLLGHRSDETITFNKATRPTDLISASKQRKNQYDYSTRGDPVSIFRSPFEKYKTINIRGSYNPLHAHSIKSVKESGEIYGDKSF